MVGSSRPTSSASIWPLVLRRDAVLGVRPRAPPPDPAGRTILLAPVLPAHRGFFFWPCRGSVHRRRRQRNHGHENRNAGVPPLGQRHHQRHETGLGDPLAIGPLRRQHVLAKQYRGASYRRGGGVRHPSRSPPLAPARRRPSRTYTCQLGLEGIVSKRNGSLRALARLVKVKNPDAPAVKRSVYCAVLALLAGLMAQVF